MRHPLRLSAGAPWHRSSTSVQKLDMSVTAISGRLSLNLG